MMASVPSPIRSLQVVDLLLKHHELTLSSTDLKTVDLDCGQFLFALAKFSQVRRQPLPFSLALDSTTLFEIASLHCNAQSFFEFLFVTFLFL
jgi:hypothetical protein